MKPKQTSPAPARGGNYWLYGWHAVRAAAANPERKILRLILTPSAAGNAQDLASRAEILEPRAFEQVVGGEAVHQGVAALVAPLAPFVLEDVLYREQGILLALDQISDPHNVGAIMRSSAAFNVCGVLVPKDHSAPESAVMAKAASGGLDIVPRITVTNLAQAFRALKEEGWWIVGLDGEAKTSLNDMRFAEKTVLVLGAEGKGMRRLTAEQCDTLVRVPMSASMESLNVSNAAAITLYQCFITRKNP
jgi:23S rRNA (guanosine2251-2'-O)-methyltransferase